MNPDTFAVFTRQDGTPKELRERVVRVQKERIVIGSVVSADLRLKGDGVSPIHAVIEITDEKTATVYDLASDTGVFINGKKVVTETLRPGEVLTIGRHQLKFSFENPNDFRGGSVLLAEGRKLFLSPEEDKQALLLEDDKNVEQIFDYRGSEKTAVEVVMAWKSTILDIEHFTRRREIILGTDRSADFGIPPMLSSKRFPLVSGEGDSTTINIDPKMRGVVQRQGKLESLDDLRSGSVPGTHGTGVPFGKSDFAKISIGDIDFYVSFTAAPPRLKRRKLLEKDPLFYRVLAASLLLTAFTITTLLRISLPQQIDAEQLPDRIATILYQPEKYAYHAKVVDTSPEQASDTHPVKPDVPHPTKTIKLDLQPHPERNLDKPVPKEMDLRGAARKGKHSAKGKGAARGQNEAKEGKGAKAKGKEGKRGQKNAAPGDEPQDRAMRPSPHGGKGAGGGLSQVADEGNVDLLKGASAKIQNLLGNVSARLGKGGEKLKGFGGFTTLGQGGLAISGNGRGGGGRADSLGGLADSGKGGGRVGTGLGAAGNGSGIIGGKTRVVIRSGGPEEAIVMGAIDADAVEAALLAHRDEFRLCYEREINAENPSLAGRVGTTFVIGSSGHVTQAGIESSTLKNANAERCILNVIRRIEFPIPRGAGIVQVSYPFKFKSLGH